MSWEYVLTISWGDIMKAKQKKVKAENDRTDPEPQDKDLSERITHQTTVAKWCAITSLMFCIYFFALCPFIDVESPLIGGPKRLLLESNYLQLSVLRNFDLIEIFFEDELQLSGSNQVIHISKNWYRVLEAKDYEITLGANNKSIKMKLLNKQPLAGGIKFFVYLRGDTQSSLPTKKFITSVLLDTKPVTLTEFYKQYLDVKQSNIKYYRSFAIENISSYLARTVGVQLLYTVTGLLIVLLVGQLIVFFGTIIEEIVFKDPLQFGKQARIPISWLDAVAEEYSTFLGFLGTVLSLWIALEQSSTDYSDFFQILAIIKYAVFTTVLGLLIRSIYGVREFWFKANIDVNTKD